MVDGGRRSLLLEGEKRNESLVGYQVAVGLLLLRVALPGGGRCRELVWKSVRVGPTTTRSR